MTQMLVVGSIGLDTIHNRHGSFEKVIGGSAIYASVAGAIFTGVQLVGIVGNDFPQETKKMLQAKNIDLTGLEVAQGDTFFWEGKYSDDFLSRESLQTELNVFGDFHPKIPDAFKSTPFVMLGNIDPELQLEVLEQVKNPKLVIADTMNFWIDSKLEPLKELLKKIDILVLNEEEARDLAGSWQIVDVAKKLREMGPSTIVIKRGEYGALLLAEEDDVFMIPAYPIAEVKDPTGAGDSFAGGLLGFVAQEGKFNPTVFRQAVAYGSAVASYCVEGVSIEKLEKISMVEVNQRVTGFQRMMHFHHD